MNKVITIGAIVGLVAAGTALYLQSQKKSDNVKVGYMTTLSGGAGIIGKQMQNAVNLAMEHKGGKLGGMNAEIIFADDFLLALVDIVGLSFVDQYFSGFT